MLLPLVSIAGALVSLSGTAQAIAGSLDKPGRLHNAQSVNLWKLHEQARRASSVSTAPTSSASLSISVNAHDSADSDSNSGYGSVSGLHVQLEEDTSGLDSPYGVQVTFDSEKREEVAMSKRVNTATFPQYNFTQPLDHFHGTTNGTFPQRYWVGRSPSFPSSSSCELTRRDGTGKHAPLHPQLQQNRPGDRARWRRNVRRR